MSYTDGWKIYVEPVEYGETVASDCRYGGVLTDYLRNSLIAAEDSESAYQGQATILIINDYGITELGWSYGSCSGCDDWESRDLASPQILGEMLSSSATYTDREAAEKYSEMLESTNETDKAMAIKHAIKIKWGG